MIREKRGSLWSWLKFGWLMAKLARKHNLRMTQVILYLAPIAEREYYIEDSRFLNGDK